MLYRMLVPARSLAPSDLRFYELRYRLRFHFVSSPIVAFIILQRGTNWNPIYTASLGMAIGALATLVCRPDLKARIWVGGAVVALLHISLMKLLLGTFFPGYIERVWSLSNVSGTLVWRRAVPEGQPATGPRRA